MVPYKQNPDAQPPRDCTKPETDLLEQIRIAERKSRSIEPGDAVCEPILNERSRRKEEDTELRRELVSIRAGVDRNHLLTKKVAGGIATIVVFATLEYLGVLGEGKPPIWSRAVIDGLTSILTGGADK